MLAVGLGGLWGSLDRVFGAGSPVRVRLGTLAPRGSSYTKHLVAMGEQWRQAPGGGVLLTVYPDGVMGSEADMVRRMRLGQLQAGMLTATGLAQIEPAVTGLQLMPMMFRSLEEVDYIGERLQPMLEKRLEEKGFVGAVLGGYRLGTVLLQAARDPPRRLAEDQVVRLGGERDRNRGLPLDRLQSCPVGDGGHSAQSANRFDQRGSVAAEHCPGRPGG